MKYLKHFVLLAVLALPAVYLQGQVEFSVQVGPDYGFYNPPPVCVHGYYPYYPFACAPYGYWGTAWFVGGKFIGAGPWYSFYYRYPGYWTFHGGSWHRGHDGHGYYAHPYYGAPYRYGRVAPRPGWNGYAGPGRYYSGGHGYAGGARGNYGGGRGYPGGSHNGGNGGTGGSRGGSHR